MFTGIVTDVGEVLAVEERAEGLRRLTIACAYDPRLDRDRRLDRLLRRLHDGGRDAAGDGNRDLVRGRCRGRDAARSPPSGAGSAGTRINLERSLKIGDELGGHLVSGHVDGIAEIVSRART